MDRQAANTLCAALPGAEVSDPWGGGHDAWKVGGKMFACIGAMGQGLAVKTPDIETAQMLIDAGVAQKAPYFHASWVLLPWDQPEAEFAHRIAVSYDLVFGKLPKKLRATIARDGQSRPSAAGSRHDTRPDP